MKRSGIKRNPEKIQEWKNRTAKRLPRASKQRKSDEKERRAFREFVLKHRPTCEARLPWCCQGRSMEVNELQRGSGREDCWLDYDKVTALCSACHRFITLEGPWAKHHGHQLIVGDRPPAEWTVAMWLREYFWTTPCKRDCTVDHRESMTRRLQPDTRPGADEGWPRDGIPLRLDEK